MSDNIQRVAFYFSAHEDDWQLFMNPAAFRDVLAGETKCVFVHVTAGDAGLGTGKGGRKHPYYLARENGAESAIRFMADSNGQSLAEARVSVAVINGHPLRRVSYRNTAAYFLRLPDGSPAGAGYADTGYQSLERLASGDIETLTAIDDSTAYRGWSDLVLTLRGLIERERGGASMIDLHLPEPEAAINPGDHLDHRMTAKAAIEAAHGLAGTRLFYHLGYVCGERPENLAGRDRDMKCAVYAVTIAGLMALDHSGAWQHYDESFVARDYFRIEDRSEKS